MAEKMVYPPQRQLVQDRSLEPVDCDGLFLQFCLWLRSFFLYIWLEILSVQQCLLRCCSRTEYQRWSRWEDQQERKKKTFQTLVTYIDAEVKETHERCVKKCQEWRRMRENTVTKVGKVAERVKVLNDDTIALQTICQGISMGAKFSMFGGPLTMMLGAGASLLANIGYNQCSKHQIKELEKMCAEVQNTLKRDSEVTKKFFLGLREMGAIPEPVRVCIRKFHSATVNGFFDSVPTLTHFTQAVKAIKNIEDQESMIDFIKVLWKEAKNLSFRSSFVAFNPEVIAQISNIVCSAAVLYSVASGIKSGSCLPPGKVLKALNILAIIKDFGDIMGRLEKFDKYPQLSKDLKRVKSKLEQEMEEISNMVKKMNNSTNYSNTAHSYRDLYSADLCLEDLLSETY